jgi:hypothetical protein
MVRLIPWRQRADLLRMNIPHNRFPVPKMRTGLWKAESQIDRSTYATAGQIYRDRLALEMSVADIDVALEKDARERLY